MMRTLRRIVAVSAALVLVFSEPLGSQQGVSDARLMGHAVVVRSSGQTSSMASGFLYTSSDLVITALHAVPDKIAVSCKGAFREATVEKVLEKADLALLRVSGGGFKDCYPVQEAQVLSNRPPDRSELILAGSYQTTQIVTRGLKLQSVEPPEDLTSLLGKEALMRLEKSQGPSAKLPIYYVQGGLLPRFSGGPVFDLSGRLVGVADGGLNRGADSYNWIIPASNLIELMKSKVAGVPSTFRRASEDLFSAPLVEDNSAPSGSGTSAGRPARDVFDAGAKAGDPPKAHWIKRLSAAELARTSDDPGAFDGLLRAVRNAGRGATFDPNQQFDIYQDVRYGLIFAAPANWQIYAHPSGSYQVNDPRYPNNRSFVSGNGFVITINGQYDVVMADDGSGSVRPSDERFFQERMDDYLADLSHPDKSSAGAILAGSARRSQFANGNKVMRFATIENDMLGYNAWAIQGDNVLAGMFVDSSAKGDANFLTMVFALNLITFHDDGGKRSPVREFRDDYTPRFTDPSTKGAVYDDEVARRMPDDPAGPPIWRFFHKRGKLWEVPSAEYLRLGGKAPTPWSYPFVEIGRKQGLVYLRNNNIQYAVPVIGGTYHISRNGGPFQPAGVVVRRPQ